MSTRDGITNVLLFWDRKDACFIAGAQLSGRIEVLVTETTAFKGVKLKLGGLWKLRWMERDAGATINFEDYNKFLNEELDVFTTNPRQRDSQWIFPGKHVFPFQYLLPVNLPSSMDGYRYGGVLYNAKAQVLIPRAEPIESLEEDFFVRARSIQVEEAQLSMELPRENVEYGRVGGGGLCSRASHVEIFLQLEKNVFKQGQIVRGHVECTVEKGKVGVESLMLLLVQETLFICNMGEEDESRRKEVLVVGKDKDAIKIAPGQSRSADFQIKTNIKMPPSGFPNCPLIDIGYFVHAVAKTDKLHDDIVVQLPVIIQHGEPEDEEIIQAPVDAAVTVVPPVDEVEEGADVADQAKEDPEAGPEEGEQEEGALPGQVDAAGEEDEDGQERETAEDEVEVAGGEEEEEPEAAGPQEEEEPEAGGPQEEEED